VSLCVRFACSEARAKELQGGKESRLSGYGHLAGGGHGLFEHGLACWCPTPHESCFEVTVSSDSDAAHPLTPPFENPWAVDANICVDCPTLGYAWCFLQFL
jgi:hypothetical protein